MPIIEHRKVRRLKPDSIWLRKHRRNVMSKNGQDGMFEKIFGVIGGGHKWCVEFGARDGRVGSNTWNLINNHGWSSVQIEGEEYSASLLRKNYEHIDRVHTMHAFVQKGGQYSLDYILSERSVPLDFDLCCIDIDGNDWHMWDALTKYKPKVVCVEFNPTVPNDVVFVQDYHPDVSQGCSLLALIELGKRKGYELIGTASWDAVFVRSDLYPLFGMKDNSIDAIWDPGPRETRIFQCYDGTIYTAGLRMLLWFKIPFAADGLQIIPPSMRHYHNPMAVVKRSMAEAERFSSIGYATDPEGDGEEPRRRVAAE